MEPIRRELTDIAKELLNIAERLYRVQGMIRDTQIISPQENAIEQTPTNNLQDVIYLDRPILGRTTEQLNRALPDVIYMGTQFRRRVVWNGESLVIKKRMRRHCPICNARFGCSHY